MRKRFGNWSPPITIIGWSPGRRQAIIWTNAAILLIRTLGTNFSEKLIEIHISFFKKMHLKMSSGKWRPFCLGLKMSIDTVVVYRSYKMADTDTVSVPVHPSFIVDIFYVNKHIKIKSRWARRRLKSAAFRLFAQSFVQAQIKENIKAPRHRLLWRKPSVNGGFPPRRASNAKMFPLDYSWVFAVIAEDTVHHRIKIFLFYYMTHAWC